MKRFLLWYAKKKYEVQQALKAWNYDIALVNIVPKMNFHPKIKSMRKKNCDDDNVVPNMNNVDYTGDCGPLIVETFDKADSCSRAL